VTRISVAHKHRTKPDHPNNSINQLSTKQPFLSSKKKNNCIQNTQMSILSLGECR